MTVRYTTVGYTTVGYSIAGYATVGYTNFVSVLPCSLSKHSTAHAALFWDGDCLTVKYVWGGVEFGLWFWGTIRRQVEISLISFCSEIYFRKKIFLEPKIISSHPNFQFLLHFSATSWISTVESSSFLKIFWKSFFPGRKTCIFAPPLPSPWGRNLWSNVVLYDLIFSCFAWKNEIVQYNFILK